MSIWHSFWSHFFKAFYILISGSVWVDLLYPKGINQDHIKHWDKTHLILIALLPTSEGKSKSKASENKGSFLQKQTATSWKRPNFGLECKMRTLLGVLDPAALFSPELWRRIREGTQVSNGVFENQYEVEIAESGSVLLFSTLTKWNPTSVK